MNTSDSEQTKSGYVALFGRPNVGKSTLLNYLLRQKISITSRKPQTTRVNLLGIDTRESHQAIYVDTPGIIKKTRNTLNRFMVDNAKSLLGDVDLAVLLIEAGKFTEADEHVVSLLKGRAGKTICGLTKIDLVKKKTDLLPQIENLSSFDLFEEILPISALKKDGIEEFRNVVFKLLPEGSHLFEENQITDKSEQFIAGELIREKVMRQLGDELPHSAAVSIESFAELERLTEIRACIHVERDSQKKIVIGSKGLRLKRIGSDARRDIEILLDRKVMLRLWVKVDKGWTNQTVGLHRLGYR